MSDENSENKNVKQEEVELNEEIKTESTTNETPSFFMRKTLSLHCIRSHPPIHNNPSGKHIERKNNLA